MKQAMSSDFSWRASAREYIELYRKAMHFHYQDLVAQGVVAPEKEI